MPLLTNPARRTIQIIRIAFIVAISVFVVACTMASGPMGMEISEDSVLDRDGFYITFDGTVRLHNAMYSNIDDADLSLSLCDVKNGKEIAVWHGSGINLRYNSDTYIPVQFRISSTAVFTAVLDSIKTENSPLECALSFNGKYLFGLVDASVDTYLGIPLAREGTVIEYVIDENTTYSYAVKLSNLAEWLIPEEDTMTATSGAYTLTVGCTHVGDDVRISMSSPDSLSDTIEALSEGVDSVSLASGNDLDAESARQIITVLQYARWIL